MASRFSAARPKRASEAFARAHHGAGRDDDDDDGPTTSKRVKFDLRNPSALAPNQGDDEDDERDDVLEADVIGASVRGTKRGAVNIDGYDSDSENENFEARAEARGRGRRGKEAEDVNLAEAMDNYDPNASAADGGSRDDEDEEVDMFGDADEKDERDADSRHAGLKKDKQVRFLRDDEIEGQELDSKSGGTVRLDDGPEGEEDEDDDDEELDEAAIKAAMEEEGVDEEVGRGGLKKHAPKIDAFNMKAEQEEGAFDEAGNYIRRAADADAVHDRWLEGISKKEMKKAAAAHERREAELRRQQRENDSVSTGDLLRNLILRLEPGETALDALARLRRSQTKPKTKKIPKWKQKKAKNSSTNGDGGGGDAMEVDAEPKEPEDPRQVKIKEAINAIAEAADKLMGRDFPNIYDMERERLIREYRNETGEAWVEPPEQDEFQDTGAPKMWEFRWTDGRDGGAKQGPFDSATMKAWQDAGYFGEGVEFRPAGQEGGWTRVASFV